MGLGPNDHHALFVRIDTHDDSGDGILFHVVGSVMNGMKYECKSTPDPRSSISYKNMKLIGTVSVTNYFRIEQICESIPAPQKQFNGFKRISPSEPLRRCQQWIAEVTQALINQGSLEEQPEDN